jgi:hypothetical protein
MILPERKIGRSKSLRPGALLLLGEAPESGVEPGGLVGVVVPGVVPPPPPEPDPLPEPLLDPPPPV